MNIINPNDKLDLDRAVGSTVAGRSHGWLKMNRDTLRRRLFILGPGLAIALALFAYMTGGCYISTDNAYVQADKVAVATDVAGLVTKIDVKNDEAVKAGQELFTIDDEPYKIALASAQAGLDLSRNQIESYKATYAQRQADLKQMQTDIAFYQREYDRMADLSKRHYASESQADQALRNLDNARQKAAAAAQAEAAALAALDGKPDAKLEDYAMYQYAQSGLDKAERNLRQTKVLAPADGIITNVDSLQPGQYLAPGQTSMSLVATGHIWIEANPKETDLTYIRAGNPATVEVDSYPGRIWQAHVSSVSPASGSEFALLPPQNASGNWVKVVQRIPVRFEIEQPADAPPLRAGMSVTVTINTGHHRSLGDLWRLVTGLI